MAVALGRSGLPPDYGVPQTVTLDVNGVATVTGPGKITLSANSGTEDILTKIVGLPEGKTVRLKAAGGHTITIAPTAYLTTPTSSYTLSGNRRVSFEGQGSDICDQISQSTND